MSFVNEFVQKVIQEAADKPPKTVRTKKSTQAEKSATGMAGEYYVAAELLRRGIHATITYGNAKSADVLAMHLSSNRFIRIEVKTSRRDKGSILVGSGKKEAIELMSESPDLLWVLCILPKSEDEDCHPSFYIYKALELKSIVLDQLRLYEEKRGKPFLETGMWTIPFKILELDNSNGAWWKVNECLADTAKA